MPGPTGGRGRLPDEGLDLEEHLRALERDLILQALRRTRGSRQQAATLLGLQRTGLVQKIARLGIADEATS